MKKIGFIAAAALLTAGVAVSANAEDITILVNGEKLETGTPAVIVDERTLVPLRAVSEALGCDVAWNGDTQGITLTDGESLYFLWIGRDHTFKTSGGALEDSSVMDTVPVIMNDYTMVPLRAISELFGAEVDWDGDTYTVTVDYEKTETQSGLAAMFATYETELDKKYDDYAALVDGTARTVKAEIQLENGGVIELELYPDLAPVTVENFVNLANDNFYDGLVFHRVIKDFMIQGGGYDADLEQKEADSIQGEFLANGYFNLIPHNAGTISMARTAVNMDSASSQFFIMHKDTPSLDGEYAAFGKVTGGMEYVDAIAEVETKTIEETGMADVPVENQIIKTITIK